MHINAAVTAHFSKRYHARECVGAHLCGLVTVACLPSCGTVALMVTLTNSPRGVLACFDSIVLLTTLRCVYLVGPMSSGAKYVSNFIKRNPLTIRFVPSRAITSQRHAHHVSSNTQRHQKVPVIPTRFTSYAIHELPSVEVLVRTLNLIEVFLAPVYTDKPACQLVFIRAEAFHRLFQRVSVRLCAIFSTGQHSQQRLFHMPREAFGYLLRQRDVVLMPIAFTDGSKLAV